MKILYHHRIASKDGQYVHIEEILKALNALGHEVIVVAPEQTQQAKFGSDGGLVSKIRATLPKPISELLEFAYSFIAFYKLCRAIVIHKPDAIYERYNLFLPAGVWAKKLFKLKLLLEVNSPLFNERQKYGGLSLERLAKWTEHYTWKNADQVLPVTKVLASYIIEAGVPEENITVIPNGIDPLRFSPSVTGNRDEPFKNKTVVGFVGFCREWHRLDEIMSLIAKEQNSDIVFLIVGDGPVIEELTALAKKLNMEDRVIITGLVERQDMPHWLDQIDIAIQPAVTPWASPLKLIEYMAKGKAIIAPDTDNIKELLKHNENALLFAPEDRAKILDCLTQLIRDPHLMSTIQTGSAQTIKDKNLTWKFNAERIVSLFAQ